MKHPFELFKELKKQNILKPQRKEAMRDMLLTEIAQREGVRVDELLRLHRQEGSKLSFLKKINVVFKRMPITVIMSIIVLLGGGTSFAAERAVPGNILYPVKIHVNEEVRAGLTFSEEGKTEWEIRRAERRLEEAAELTESGTLNAETRAELEINFKKHATAAERGITSMEEQGKNAAAEDIAAQFESSLKAHESILVALRAQSSVKEETKTEVQPVLQNISTTLKGIVTVRENLEATSSKDGGSDVSVAAEARIKVAEKNLEESKDFIEKKKDQMSSEARTKAEITLQEGNRALVEARTTFEAKAYAEAFRLASKASRLAHEAKSYTEASILLEVRIGGDRTTNTATPSTTPVYSSTPSPLIDIRGEGSLETELDLKGNRKEGGTNGSLKGSGNLRLKVGE